MDSDKEQIRHTLSAILHAQGEELAAEVLDTAKVEIAYSGHDFGKDIYSLDLRIPAVRFGQLEQSLQKIEKKIQMKLWKLGLDTENETYNSVNIYPEPVVGPGAIAVLAPTKTDESRIWKPKRIRLFLSHVSRIKVSTSELKKALVAYGIDAFVAHMDIQPTLEWQREIELALRSMDMLCALVTDDFISSRWTDQEVGFALGRGVPVVAIRCGADPYGLLGKHQALAADVSNLPMAAPDLVNIIAKQEILHTRLTEGLVDAVSEAISFQQAKDGIRMVKELSKHLTDAQIIRLLEAARDNSQVRDAHGVPSLIAKIASGRRVSLPLKTESEASPFDDDIPF